MMKKLSLMAGILGVLAFLMAAAIRGPAAGPPGGPGNPGRPENATSSFTIPRRWRP